MSEPLAVGDVINGKYRVERVLGEGAMGIVFAALDAALDRRVAIKVLQPEMASQPQAAARFLREARTAAKIRSEHVCRVLDVDRLESGAPFMVMELLEGRDLDAVVGERGGRLPPDEVAELLLQACEAIAEAHAHGIVHRDLKPANLFLTTRSDGSTLVKVLDFGISKGPLGPQGVELTAPGSAVGSPLYMSPEQMRASPDVDARSDIWGLGAILYELLSGSPPFPGRTLPEVAAMVLTTDAAPLSTHRHDVDPGLTAIVARCLQRDVAHRYEDVGELAADLARYAAPSSRVHVERILKTLSVALEGAMSGGPSVFARSGESLVGSDARASALPAGGGGRAVFKVGFSAATAQPEARAARSGDAAAATSAIAEPPRRRNTVLIALALGVLTIGGLAALLTSGGAAQPVASAVAPAPELRPAPPADTGPDPDPPAAPVVEATPVLSPPGAASASAGASSSPEAPVRAVPAPRPGSVHPKARPPRPASFEDFGGRE